MTSSIEKELLSKIDVLHLPGPTTRVEAIRERFISLTPEICVERAQYITESYKETEDQPIHIRRAKALGKILGQMTIFIQPDEIIVGNQCTKPRAAPVFPEFSCKWLEDELDRLEKRTGDVFLISEAKKATLREIFPYWNGKTTNELATALMLALTCSTAAATVFRLVLISSLAAATAPVLLLTSEMAAATLDSSRSSTRPASRISSVMRPRGRYSAASMSAVASVKRCAT